MRRPVEIFKYTKDNNKKKPKPPKPKPKQPKPPKEREVNSPASDAESGCGISMAEGFWKQVRQASMRSDLGTADSVLSYIHSQMLA